MCIVKHMKFNCNTCDYSTDIKFCYDKHLTTNKHTLKVNEVAVNILKIIKINNKYKCNHCNSLFNAIADIERHIKLECKYDVRYNNFYIFDEKKLGKYLFKNSVNAGDIYIVQTDFSLDTTFKIGISTRLEERMSQYRTGCNYEPKLHCYFPCKDVKYADNIIKEKLKNYKVKREIYKGNLNDIKKIILETLYELNNKKSLVFSPDVKINDVCECVDCNEVFFMKCDLMEHNKQYHDNVQLNIIEKDFKCSFCGNTFANAGNLSRHKTSCLEKQKLIDQINELNKTIKLKDDKLNETIKLKDDKLNETIKLKDEAIKQKDETIDRIEDTIAILKSENAHLKSVVNDVGSIVKTSVSTMAYVVKNYKDAPALLPLKDYKMLNYDQPDDEFVEELGSKFKHKLLGEYIAEFIVKNYKKTDPAKQSLWNSDTSRLTYIIRDIVTKKKVDWKVDKKGVNTTKYVIEPLIDHIEKMVREYIQNYDIDYEMFTGREAEKKMMKLKYVTDVLRAIEDKTLHDDVLRCIAPHFFLNKVGVIAE